MLRGSLQQVGDVHNQLAISYGYVANKLASSQKSYVETGLVLFGLYTTVCYPGGAEHFLYCYRSHNFIIAMGLLCFSDKYIRSLPTDVLIGGNCSPQTRTVFRCAIVFYAGIYLHACHSFIIDEKNVEVFFSQHCI